MNLGFKGVLPFRSVASSQQVLLPGGPILLANPLVYSNAHLAGQPWFADLRLARACARQAVTPDVVFGRYPPGTLLLGGGADWTWCDGWLCQEQIAPGFTNIVPTLDILSRQISSVVETGEECLLLSRWGAITWGHWLSEILPRAVIAEAHSPGRFRYVLPATLVGTPETNNYARSLLGSLAAYGIAPTRLLLTDSASHHRFDALFGLAGILSGKLSNPHLLSLVSDNVQTPGSTHGPLRLAITRRDAKTRAILNQSDIDLVLDEHGFEPLDMASLPFGARVDAMKQCESVFGIWGSGFSYLVYAPQGVEVVSAGPADWEDDYFTGLIQQREARFADLRGPSLWDGTGVVRDASFYLQSAQLRLAFEALSAATAEAPEVTVMGRQLSRTLSAPILTIDFAQAGRPKPYLGEGWAAQEIGMRWSVGARSTLEIPGALLTEPTEAILELITFVTRPFLKTHKLTIRIDGVTYGEFAVGAWARCVFRLPPLGADGRETVLIELLHPIHPSPKALNLSSDDRPLGIGALSLTFHPLRPPPATV